MNKYIGFRNELKYAFYVIFHPFNGFWDLKHEKRGSLRASMTLVFMLIIVFITEDQFTGYYFSNSKPKSILIHITSVLFLLFLWCISNWCITTLLDGKGTFNDILTASGYALTPMLLIHIPLIILSNVVTAESATFYSILSFVAIAWSVILLFAAIMSVHQFTASKAFFTCILAIVGMAVIVFLVVTFLAIIQQVYDLFNSIWREFVLRF